jgi:ectoine hydroxylase-related dioxygenase (phytanoyl-CoA dioxygenase family)
MEERSRVNGLEGIPDPVRTPPVRKDYESSPYLNQKRRVTQLYPELRSLGLLTHIADLAMQGYTVVPPEKVIPEHAPDCIERLREAVLRVSERRTGVYPDYETGSTHRDGAHPLGQFMRFVLFEDPIFEPVLTHPVLLGLITYLVGHDALLSLNDAMIKGPGAIALPIHNDNGDKNTAVFTDQPQTANINLLLNDYDEGSGTIAFLPGSHVFRREPTPGEMRDLVPEMVPIVAKAGSAIIWPANTWHMAFPRTKPGLRVTLLYDFCRGHLQTQSDFRNHVSQEVLARNPPRFAQLMHVHGVFPFREGDIEREKVRQSGKRYSLFDCHPQWKPPRT